MTFRIRSLSVQNYRRFSTLEIAFPPDVAVLTGPNGVGKTAVLDALAIGLAEQFGRSATTASAAPKWMDLNRQHRVLPEGLRGGKVTLRLDYLFGDEVRSVQLPQSRPTSVAGAAGLSELSQIRGAQPLVAYFRADRSAPSVRPNKTARAERPAAPSGNEGWFDIRLASDLLLEFFAERDRSSAQELALALERGEDPVLHMPRHRRELRAIDRVLSTFSFDEAGQADRVQGVFFSLEKRQLQARVGNPEIRLPFDSLSSGWRSIVTLAVELARRAVSLNPEMGPEAPERTPGVVLIDELDLHLHPSWQQRILPDLRAAFPLMQFVITSHSPLVLSSVQPGEALTITSTAAGEGVVGHPDFTLGAEAGLLLESVYGTSERPPMVEEVQVLNRYRSLVASDQFDGSEADQLRQRLEAWSGGADPELAALFQTVEIKQAQLRARRARGDAED